MIQRIQTVYFGLAFLLICSTFLGTELFSVKLDTFGTNTFDVTVFNVLSENIVVQSSTLWIYSSVAALAVLLTLLNYKSRDKQLTLAKMSIVIVLLISVWFMVTGYQFLSKSEFPKNHGVIPGVGFYLFASSVVFVILGLMGVRKDKKLIDSLNRLR